MPQVIEHNYSTQQLPLQVLKVFLGERNPANNPRWILKNWLLSKSDFVHEGKDEKREK
jgi:hypothetical protein